MIDIEKFTLDWLQFIEQVKDRVKRGDGDFEYQLDLNTKAGDKITFLIKVTTEQNTNNLFIIFPPKKKKKDIA